MNRSSSRAHAQGKVRSLPITASLFIVGLIGIAGLSMPISVQGGDAGEFATVMLKGGIPHPSGYPWMRILGQFSQVLLCLGVSPVLAAAIPCAIAGVLSWALVAALVCKHVPKFLAYSLTIIVSASPLAISHVYDSEVWGPHLLLCSLVIYLALSRRSSNIFVLSCVFGIAISHHLTAVLLAPLVIGTCWFETRSKIHASESRSWQSNPTIHDIITGITALTTCVIVPYSFLAIGSGGAWRWGDTQSLQGWLSHITRADYGSLQLSLHNKNIPTQILWDRSWGKIAETFSSGLLNSSLFGLALMVATFLLARKPPAKIRKSSWTGYWCSIVATTVLFPALANIDPTQSTGAWILERFDLLPVLLWIFPITLAWTRLLARLPTRLQRICNGGVLAILFISCLTPERMALRPRTDHGVQSYAIDLLNTPEPVSSDHTAARRSIIFGTDDHRTFPVLFAQEVLAIRPDVLYIDAQLLAHSWYRKRLQEKFEGLPDIDKPVQLILQILSTPELQDTPIYLANTFSIPSESIPVFPEGILWRVSPPRGSSTPMHAQAIYHRHLAALSRTTADIRDFPSARTSEAQHPWSANLLRCYTNGSREMIDALRKEGFQETARDLEQRIDAWKSGNRSDSY